jgi:hypothetical protein
MTNKFTDYETQVCSEWLNQVDRTVFTALGESNSKEEAQEYLGIYPYLGGTVTEEIHIANEGQTLFTLTNPYYVGNNSLSVYRNGLKQVIGEDYTEVNASTVLFLAALVASERVQFVCGSATPTNDAASLVYTPDGGVTTTVHNKLSESVSVKDFGAKGDGVTDDTAAIQSAILNGKHIYVPAGTYKIKTANSVLFTINAATKIYGAGKANTIFNITSTTTTGYKVFDIEPSGSLDISGLTVNVGKPTSSYSMTFSIAGSNITIANCEFNGNVTDNGTNVSHEAYFIAYPNSGAQNNLTVENSVLHHYTYGILKANSYLSTQKNLRFTGNEIYSIYRDGLQFNSPAIGSEMSNIVVNRNYFHDHAGWNASALVNKFWASFAGPTDFIVTDNLFSGETSTSLQVEGSAARGIISNNTIRSGLSGIRVVSSVVAYPSAPSYINIINNTVIKTGTVQQASTHGIYCEGTQVPSTNILVAYNNITKFYHGITTNFGVVNPCAISNNIVSECYNGITDDEVSSNISHNITSLCVNGFNALDGGRLVGHTFHKCTNLVTGVVKAVALIDPTIVFPPFNISAGVTTVKALFPMLSSTRLFGNLSYTLSDTGGSIADTAMEVEEVSWNGTTFSNTQKMTYQIGTISVGISNAGNALNATFFSATEKTDLRYIARLTGTYVQA